MQLSNQVKLLEDIFCKLNETFFDSKLSASIITIQTAPKTYGHFTPFEAWEDTTNGYYEINIGAEYLNRPLECTVATLLHEMVHQYCFENDIKDTSRSGSYHNKRFKAEGEKRNLMLEYSRGYGWSGTSPTPALIDFCMVNWKDEMTIHRILPTENTKKKKQHAQVLLPNL